MSRTMGLIASVLLLVLAGGARGEIVRVTAAQTTLYDAETKETQTAGIQGKRFMVYGAAKDWYLIEAKVSGERKLVWIPMADVTVDWGQTKQVRVVSVVDTNTLKLEGDTWAQFAGIEVTRVDSPVTRQTLTWLKGLLEGKQVTLEFDPKFKKNRAGYTLAYVYLDGMFVNRTLVEYGLASSLKGYTTGSGRYASVFSHYEAAAKEKRLGAWAALLPADNSTTPGPAAPDQDQPETDTWSEPEQIRTLTPAERMQWAKNLVTEVKVSGTRDKTKRSEVAEGGDPTDPARVDEITWTKTLSVTIKNGWGRQLSDLVIRYELFSKTGATSDTVSVFETGAFALFNLRPSETRTFAAPPVTFKGTDSSERGWQGYKYYGYRVTYLHKGTVIKVDALPSSLVSFKVGEAVE